MLKAEHISKVFRNGSRRFEALSDVSFELGRAEWLGIAGASGAGKSTLVKILTRLTEPTAGRIELLGKDITHARGRRLREAWRRIQMVFQDPTASFDPRRTLGDGIGEGLRNMGMSRAETEKRTEELLVRCGLPPSLAARYPREVSGGQCQRAAVARALAVNPAVLICDEATAALDPASREQILRLLSELRGEEGLSILMICHDPAVMEKTCGRILTLHNGRFSS